MSKLEILAAVCFGIGVLWSLLSLVRRHTTIIDTKGQYLPGVELQVEVDWNRRFPYDEI